MGFLQNSGPSLAPSLLRRFLDILNYPFVHQNQFSISILSLALAALIIFLAATISKYARRFLDKRMLARFDIDGSLKYSLLTVIHYVIIGAGLLYAAKVGLSIDLTSVALIVGFLSVGIGFGLQYLASDLISGLILLFERPVKIGDRVKVGDVEGKVEAISLRTTVIVTNDQIAVITPNSELVRNRFVNWSYGSPVVRIAVQVGVSYDSDVEQVRSALFEAADGVKEVLRTRTPEVRLRQFGDSAIQFELLVWIDAPHNHQHIRSEINYRILERFREHRIEMPFPQRELHFHPDSTGMPGGSLSGGS